MGSRRFSRSSRSRSCRSRSRQRRARRQPSRSASPPRVLRAPSVDVQTRAGLDRKLADAPAPALQGFAPAPTLQHMPISGILSAFTHTTNAAHPETVATIGGGALQNAPAIAAPGIRGTNSRNFRKDPCKQWTLNGSCMYGEGCTFLHAPPGEPMQQAMNRLIATGSFVGTPYRAPPVQNMHASPPSEGSGSSTGTGIQL
eukprot:TRINITY_DN105842_c0_g1_i1.p1 TRINITY_DN105842_c0_g1~~TRINITY_DN105842_c0_g1_i1.p1  ORF type:complete len:215 (+),score=29.40 TRINITY_DN105842_c0_g1_i1:47-646(+)